MVGYEVPTTTLASTVCLGSTAAAIRGMIHKVTASSNPTVAQVAKIAGVSKATASEALRDSPKVAQPTKDRVVAVARNLGYRANLGAAGLRAGVRPAVAVLLNPAHVSRPYSVGYFFHGWLGSFVRTASAAGVSVTFLASHDVDELAGRDIAAVVLFGSPVKVEQARALGFGIPVIHVSTGHHHDTGAAVVLCHPNEDVVAEVTAHLADSGAHGPAFVLGREEVEMANEVRVFQESCRRRGLPASVIDTAAYSTESTVAAQLAEELTPDIDAIYSRLVNPSIIADAAKLAERTIGQDLLLVCDTNQTRLDDPSVSLSSVDFLGVESGRLAAQVVLEVLERNEDRVLDMPHSFTVRESSVGPLET